MHLSPGQLHQGFRYLHSDRVRGSPTTRRGWEQIQTNVRTRVSVVQFRVRTRPRTNSSRYYVIGGAVGGDCQTSVESAASRKLFLLSIFSFLLKRWINVSCSLGKYLMRIVCNRLWLYTTVCIKTHQNSVPFNETEFDVEQIQFIHISSTSHFFLNMVADKKINTNKACSCNTCTVCHRLKLCYCVMRELHHPSWINPWTPRGSLRCTPLYHYIWDIHRKTRLLMMSDLKIKLQKSVRIKYVIGWAKLSEVPVSPPRTT